jgi:hypothetical protein
MGEDVTLPLVDSLLRAYCKRDDAFCQEGMVKWKGLRRPGFNRAARGAAMAGTCAMAALRCRRFGRGAYLKFTEMTTWPFGSRPTYRAKTVVFGAVGVSFVIVPRDRRSPFFSAMPSALSESLIHRTTFIG